MEYPAEKINIRLDDLGFEHIVYHVCEPLFEFLWYLAVNVSDILHDDREVGKVTDQL